jgi:alpha-methylacyl-CoA racemase
MDRAGWPALRERIAGVFRTRSQAAWTERFGPAEACGAPVLGLDQLAADPHLASRQSVTAAAEGILTAAPAPRLSAHPDLVTDILPRQARSAEQVLAEAGFTPAEIEDLGARNVIWSL